MFIRLYKQYVRPHLEFCTQVWSPWTVADKTALEKVQKKAVGMVSGLSEHMYEERLTALGLQSLEERRHQADMHMMHKIMHGSGGLDHQTWFNKGCDSGRATRSTADPLNVTVKSGRLDIRTNSLVSGHQQSGTLSPRSCNRHTDSSTHTDNLERMRCKLPSELYATGLDERATSTFET